MPESSGTREAALYERLREIETVLSRELRLRGFDPAQLENTALTGKLASLAAERTEIRKELTELKEVRQQ